MSTNRNSIYFNILSLVSLALFATCTTLKAQGYPVKPVRLIVPFASGGGTPDSVARIIGQALSSQTGQTFIVDNRPGANGLIGAELLAKSPPDGYTLMIVSTSFAINPSMYKKLPYNWRTDFTPVTNICGVEALFVLVNPSVPARTLQEFIAYAKRPENKVSYGSPGIGNSLHLAAELLNNRAGIKMVHIPYKGSGPAMAALIAGDIQAMLLTPPQTIQGVKAGQVRALAYTGKKRASFLLEVPTTGEAGLQGMEFDGGWFAMFGPANMPETLLNKIHSEVRAALSTTIVRERFDAMGLVSLGTSPAEFRPFLESQVKAYAEMIKLAGVDPE
jgi:tripartite-type tricarboxylate transporter receptor subunit TctC